ncbi:MAG: nicotinate (nicotinamide) nucleotide adenylyltransferase [Kordiimonadales bacterium]|nr:MAG: nicotinate (nicotinamide) nucleotide adenylyltransferase [Kordiimonadales bacterium]
MTNTNCIRSVPEFSSLNRGRKIGLYGGSFNPAHGGHLHVAHEALKRLKLDEIWFLVSPGNPLKSADGMAPFSERLASLQSVVRNRPNMRVSDIENKLNTRYTADTVQALVKALPFTYFTWVMGADNLSTFDQWHKWRCIVETLPIAVFDRAGYASGGFASELARRYARFRTSPENFGTARAPTWTFVTIPRHPGSATNIRRQQGENWFAKNERKDT